MLRSFRVFLVVALATLLTSARASMIDFEDALVYGGDNATISDQYFQDHGMGFSFLTGRTQADASGANAIFEQRGSYGGDPYEGFRNGHLGNARDVEHSSVQGQLGEYFLTSAASAPQTGYVKLSIDYATAVNGASGELWDIDGNGNNTEQFAVSAFNADGHLVASLTSPVGVHHNQSNSLDGLPWTWSVGGGELTRIEIEFVGTKKSNVGFAFDNFSYNAANLNADSHAAPLPGAFGVGIVGLLGLAVARRRRRQIS